MRIPKTKAAWKKLQATNMKEAMRFCKEYARQFNRLTVPAIAELMGESDDTLYKWLSTGRLPAMLIPAYEHICGIDYITQYLAYRSHKLMIEIPAGKTVNELGINELQQISAEAMGLLIKFYREGGDPESVASSLTQVMAGIAYHRENVLTQPSLEFDGDDE